MHLRKCPGYNGRVRLPPNRGLLDCKYTFGFWVYYRKLDYSIYRANEFTATRAQNPPPWIECVGALSRGRFVQSSTIPSLPVAFAGVARCNMKNDEITIGVLALQGAVQPHIRMLEQCGVKAIPVRFVEEIDMIDGLIIPGGESTTVGKLMDRYGIDKKIIERAEKGMPILGTCTGMILLAKEIVNSDQHRLGLIDTTILRNAFGRQVDSFEADLDIEVIGKPLFRAVFIRAPYAVHVNGKTEVLARFDDKVILLKQGNLLGCAFHPELTEDTRVHEYFIGLVKNWLYASCSEKAV